MTRSTQGTGQASNASPRAPTAVLLHGWGGSFASTFKAGGWPADLAALPCPAFGIDLPGHADPQASTDPADYADLAALVAQQLPDAPCDLIAYSLGAKIALEIASRHPRRVRRMALMGIGDNAFLREPSADAVIAALEHGVTADTAPAVADLVTHAQRSGSNLVALAAMLRRAPNPIASDEKLARITAPTLLINSDADRLAIPDDRLARALPHCTHHRISGVVHSDIPASPEFRAACLDFVQGTMAGTAPAPLSGDKA